MIKLIIGTKGTGKTKTLIEMVNNAIAATKGSVVCIEKGDKLKYDIKYQCRLIDTEDYQINDGQALYGFIAGILASNHDVTDIFVDSALKICQQDAASFDYFIKEIDALLKNHEANLVMTSSLPVEDASDTVKKYL
jgi:ABC-type phosphate/phosphonate transport system ATPase subunit